MLILQGIIGPDDVNRRFPGPGETEWIHFQGAGWALRIAVPHPTYRIEKESGYIAVHDGRWSAGGEPWAAGGSYLILHTTRPGALMIESDRVGTIPIYWAAAGGRTTVFGTRLPDVASALPWGAEPDRLGVLQTLLLAYPWGDRTQVEGVRLLPPAHRTLLTPGGLRESHAIWQPPPVNREPAGSITPWVDAAVAALTEAHRTATAGLDEDRTALPVTAGLDSRCNLALNPGLSRRAGLFHCHDLGDFELPIAERIARHLGHPLDIFPAGQDMRDAPNFDASLGPGDFNIGHWRLVGTARRLRDAGYRATVDGYLQDLLFKATFLIDRPRHELIERRQLVARYVARRCGLPLPGATASDLDDAVATDYPAGATGLDASQAFYLTHRSRRLVYNIVRLNHHYLDVRTPALDHSLINFGLQLPWELRRNAYLYRRIIAALAPDLAMIPYDKTGLPLLDPRPATLKRRLTRRVRPYLNRLWPNRPWLRPTEDEFARLARNDASFRIDARVRLDGSRWLQECLELERPGSFLFDQALEPPHIDLLGGMLTVAALERSIEEPWSALRTGVRHDYLAPGVATPIMDAVSYDGMHNGGARWRGRNAS